MKFIKVEEVCGGFAAIFEWIDGECMDRMYPLSIEKFMQMQDRTRLKVFNDILAFHIHTIEQGYVVIDFYDESIMYDFVTKRPLFVILIFIQKRPI